MCHVEDHMARRLTGTKQVQVPRKITYLSDATMTVPMLLSQDSPNCLLLCWAGLSRMGPLEDGLDRRRILEQRSADSSAAAALILS
jgi:hypothetical protein